jgi:hypothetical protein
MYVYNKTLYLLELTDAYAPVIRAHLLASYDHAGKNGGCNSDSPLSPNGGASI